MKKTMILISTVLFLSATISTAHAAWDWLTTKLQTASSTKLSDTAIGDGLKEALRVGIENSIALLSKEDGFLKNESAKILMPSAIRKTQPLLEKAGLGPTLDEFVLSMNRAAEKATPLAADIFSSAIADMSFDDVQKIRNGGDTAATDYFKDKTSQQLTDAFKPMIASAMNDYAVTEKYQTIMNKVKTLPLMGKFAPTDIESYVTSKALDGLFLTIGKEEANIRNNPSARINQVLQDVFK